MTTVVLVSPLCSRDVYRTSVPEEFRTGQAMQKFHRLLAGGMVQNGASVQVLSAPPLGKHQGSMVYRRLADVENGVSFYYLTLVRPQTLGRLIRMVETAWRVHRGRSGGVDVVLADPMNVMSFLGAYIGTRLSKTPLVGVVADVPTYYAGNVGQGKSLFLRASEFLMTRADAYVLLTSQMADLVNPRARPAVVVEGIAEVAVGHGTNRRERKVDGPRIMLYAGGIRKAYGLDRLLAAYAELDDPYWEFHIYGGGPFAEEFAKMCDDIPRAKYMGVKDNDIVVEAQQQASLLVNPRLSDHEYTRFSFPSKIIEYMVSGTATLTTQLSGIPNDYLPHLLLFDDESQSGMRSTLAGVFKTPGNQLKKVGEAARVWIETSKSARAQTKIVLDMVNRLVDPSSASGRR